MPTPAPTQPQLESLMTSVLDWEERATSEQRCGSIALASGLKAPDARHISLGVFRYPSQLLKKAHIIILATTDSVPAPREDYDVFGAHGLLHITQYGPGGVSKQQVEELQDLIDNSVGFNIFTGEVWT